MPNRLGGGTDSTLPAMWDSRGRMKGSTFDQAEQVAQTSASEGDPARPETTSQTHAGSRDSAEVERTYLLVSAESPLEARAAILRAPSAPDLCVRSPSPDARRAAEAALAGGYVRTIVEPLLARRGEGESLGDFMWRSADALRTLYAFDTRTALVVFDELPGAHGALRLEEHELLRFADELERTAPAA
jgi:hypothetical protein